MGYENIPEELRRYPNWVCWQAVPSPKKDDPYHIGKLPVNPVTGGKASTAYPPSWSDFNTALSASERFSGIGFVFTDTPFFGVDLDGKDAEIRRFLDGDERGIIGEFVNGFKSYTEISQSGKGLHIICRGALPEGRRRDSRLGIEMYETGRFFALTGNIAGKYRDISEGTEAARILHEKYLGENEKNVIYTPPAVCGGNIPELLEKAARSKTARFFPRLWKGAGSRITRLSPKLTCRCAECLLSGSAGTRS